MIKEYASGSLWRKWDLHIHTPGTKLNDQYKTPVDQDALELFCEKIEESDVSVFGITDYFSVDSYFAFVSKFSETYSESEKVFFPNVEFRIDSKNSGGDHIQIHVLFSNEQAVLEKLPDFFTRLELVSTDDENLTSKYCNEADLNEVTYEKAMVKIDTLLDTLKKDFVSGEYIIVGLANGFGSIRPESSDGRGSEYAKEIDKVCHMFFGKNDNVDFFLNKIEGRDQYKLKPKPVIIGSDSHSFETFEKKVGVSYTERNEDDEITDFSEITWIKADPTFEGLRQTIFEPEERVKIQELIPDDKELYRVISHINIDDSNFTNKEIKLNPNLNVIIGSRSSGKTTLLGSIARSVDEEEFQSRYENLPPVVKDPPETIVTWLDGTSSLDTEIQKGITYIPQNYINNLTEATEGDSPILEIAESALFKSEGGIQEKIQNMDISTDEINRNIGDKIHRLFILRKQIFDDSENIKKVGDKKGIGEQIKKIEGEVSKLQKDFTPEDLETLETIRKNYGENKNKIELIGSDIESIKSEVEALGSNPDIFPEHDIGLKSDSLTEELKAFTDSLQSDYSQKYLAFLDEKKVELEKIKEELVEKNKQILTNNKPLIDRSKENKTSEQKLKEKDAEQKKLDLINEAEKELSSRKELLGKTVGDLVDLHTSRSKLRTDFASETTGDLDGIEYTAVVGVDMTRLDKYLIDNINFHNSTSARTALNKIPDYRNGEDYESKVLIESNNIQTVLNLILDQELLVKTGVDLQRAVEGLFDDYEFINYSLKYEGDEYPEMTPGKKSLVVLKLLVDSSDDQYPILIDQPEDDLDSRSISTEIVDFLRDKKKDRQIILVTHNANIAIKADSEEIIVANRDGSENKNENDVPFDYKTGSIEMSFVNSDAEYTLEKMGIREHACELLEGGEEAFENRRNKYNLK